MAAACCPASRTRTCTSRVGARPARGAPRGTRPRRGGPRARAHGGGVASRRGGWLGDAAGGAATGRPRSSRRGRRSTRSPVTPDRAHGARLPLALAQLGRARARRTATSRSKEASSRWTARRADGCPARGVGVAVPRRFLAASDDEYIDAMREGLRIAAPWSRPPCTTRTAGSAALRFWQRLARRGRADAARLAVASPRARRPGRASSGSAPGSATPVLRLGYLKVFMDGTLGSQTARLLDGPGVEITSREELAEIGRAGARRRLPVAVHAIGDRANRDALDAFEATPRRVGAARAAPAHRARAVLAPEDIAVSRSSASRRRCSSATPRRIATSLNATGPDRPTARTRSARCWTRAPSSRTGRTRRSRSSTRWRASAPGFAPLESARRGIRSRRVTVEQALEATSSRRPGCVRGAPAREAAPRLPRGPRRARPRPARDPARGATRGARSWRRWSAAVGAQPAALGRPPTRACPLLGPVSLKTRVSGARRGSGTALSQSRRRARCGRRGTARSASGCSRPAGRSR